MLVYPLLDQRDLPDFKQLSNLVLPLGSEEET